MTLVELGYFVVLVINCQLLTGLTAVYATVDLTDINALRYVPSPSRLWATRFRTCT